MYYPVHSLVALYTTESLNVLIRVKGIKTSRVTCTELDEMNGNQCVSWPEWWALERALDHLYWGGMTEISRHK